MAFKLLGLDELDKTIEEEHRAWLCNARLKENFGIKLTEYANQSGLGLLNFPKLWSGNRAGETSIESDPNAIPIDFLEEISRQKQKYRAKYWDQEVERWEKLEEDYKKFLEHLKERFLAQAIKITLNSLPADDAKTELEKFYKDAERSPVNWQTQDQCVAEHEKITLAIKNARAKQHDKDTLKILEQLEILSKRRVDMHYENATKQTTADVVTSGISATSSTLGMVTAFAAAACWIGGFFFPPLWGAAAILGAISFVAYISTAISVGKVIRNGINGRPPSRSEVKDLAIEAALAPLNVIGKFFIGFRHFVKSSTLAKSILTKAGEVSTNLFSNVTDAPWVKDNIAGARDAVSDAKKHRASGNDTALTSSAKVLSELLKKYPVDKANKITAKIDKALNDNTSVLVQLKKKQVEGQKVCDLHLVESFPTNLKEFKNSYILNKTDKVLYYINYARKITKINITDSEKLLKDINDINEENSNKISLTDAQFKQLITENGGHEQKMVSKLILTTRPSEHAKISDWSFGFRMSIRYKTELQPIQAALDQYKTLPVNATYAERIFGLQSIFFECEHYKLKYPDKNLTPSTKIEELQKIVSSELENLGTIAQDEELQTSRPLLVGR